MDDYKQRMLAEHKELVGKIVKLKAFLWTPVFNELKDEDRTLLIVQFAHMQGYERTLSTRIARQ